MSENLKICIFPNDPLIAYYNKGEIKNRYYNPCEIFDEVHVLSFTDKEIDEEKVQSLVGKAKLKIHCVGKINFKNRKKHEKQIIQLVKEINPNVIRSYNSLLQGWCAASCSKNLKIPFFLSLHTQYDYYRALAKKNNLKKYLSLKYTEKFIEPFVIKNADKITIVYKIIEPYVLKHGGKKPELLYNKVNLDRFQNGLIIESLPQPLIISVGSLTKEKNHRCLIEAMKQVGGHCLIIGNGVLYDELIQLIRKNNLEKKITIKKSVQNKEIQNYYKSASVFALCFDPELEGLPIPIMEAMAAGLPVIMPYPKVGFSEGLDNIAIFSERSSQAFAEKINLLLKNENLRRKFSELSAEKAKSFDSEKLEEKEAQIYRDLIYKN